MQKSEYQNNIFTFKKDFVKLKYQIIMRIKNFIIDNFQVLRLSIQRCILPLHKRLINLRAWKFFI